MRRRAALGVALAPALLLLASCGGGAPPGPPPFPTIAADSLERECACVERRDCQVPRAADGQMPGTFAPLGETRDFQCRWDDRAAVRATCAYDTRSREDRPGAPWASWSRVTVNFRHDGARGWCWTDRASRNDLIPNPPEESHPPAVRQPTEAEAQRVAAGCGTRARRAAMPPGLLRLAPWGVYEPVEGATEEQRRCFMREIRRLIARPAAGVR